MKWIPAVSELRGETLAKDLAGITRQTGTLSQTLHPPCPVDGLQAGLDSPIPDTVVIGRGNAIHISGWCYHPKLRVRYLEIQAGSVRQPIRAYGFSRPDPVSIPTATALPSGFRAIVCFPADSSEGRRDLFLRAVLDNGEEEVKPIGSTFLQRESATALDEIVVAHPSPPDLPLICVCLATYNPGLDLFSRQIQSLSDQTYRNWICIISDDSSDPDIYQKIRSIAGRDSRFSIHRTAAHLGFYLNFDRCLSLVPAHAAYVALCDHDDSWHPDKLETLLKAFDADTTLAYSDMNVVDEQGRTLYNTYWTTRQNNYKQLTSLLIANTITGAASMFRRSSLEFLLPFPPAPGNRFHDHWIGCVSLALGKIAYVNRPLYDYVQHNRNVVGHLLPEKWLLLKNLWITLSRRQGLSHALAYWRRIYFDDVLRIEMIAQVIQLRASEMLTRRNRRSVSRILHLDDSVASCFWLPFCRVQELWRGNQTLGAETRLLRGLIWKHCASLRRRRPKQG